MNKIRVHTKALLCITVIVVIFTAAMRNLSSDGNAIFYEEVSFGGFYTSYDEPFSLLKDTNLRITLKSKIEKGIVSLRIYSKEGEICYEIAGSNLNENVVMPIKKGDWFYEFHCYSEEKKKEAENGEYSVRIEVDEESEAKME